MDWLVADDLTAARWLLSRSIAALYVLAFANAAVQWRGLLGDDGLLPVRQHLTRLDLRRRPTIFGWRYSDRGAVILSWGGAVVAATLVLGLPQQGPSWVPMSLWLLLWALYLSIVHVGQIWYAFGWESILLEAGFLAALLGSDASAPTWPALLMLRWLLIRIELGAGLIKLRGDPCWRDLTCLEYHHETQPLPGPLSWWAHNRPRWWHRVEVAGNHVTQLVVPFGLLLPQPVAGVSAVAIMATQGWLVLTGNFAWLNTVTIVLALSALPDAWLAWLPVEVGGGGSPAAWLIGVVLGVSALTVVLSWWPVRNMFSSTQQMNVGFNRFHLVGSYGAFGSVTRTRVEVVLEGTDASDPHDPDAEWVAYRFRAKPGDPSRRPPQVAPWHFRLDWLMWFVPLRGPAGSRAVWFQRLVRALLVGTPSVLRLLAHDPFPGQPPRWVRARLVRYRFTTPDERRATGEFWVTEEAGPLLGPVGDRPSEDHLEGSG